MFERKEGETYYDVAKRFNTEEGKLELQQVARDIAKDVGLPESKFLGLLSHESANWNPLAKNPKSSATGLGQFLNATATEEGFQIELDQNGQPGPNDERWHPGRNMFKSANYLKKLYDQTGDWDLAIKRYGEGTDAYLDKVNASIAKYEKEPGEAKGVLGQAWAGVKSGVGRSLGKLAAAGSVAAQAHAAPELGEAGEFPQPGRRETIERFTPAYTPPKGLAEELARGGGEAVGGLPELLTLSTLLGPALGPASPYIGTLGANILRSALPFAAATATEPESTGQQVGAAGAAGAALPFIHPLPWYMRAPAAGAIGAAQAKLGTPEAGPKEVAKSGTIMALMSLLGRQQGYGAPTAKVPPPKAPAAEVPPPFRGKVYSMGPKSTTFYGPNGEPIELPLDQRTPLGYGEASGRLAEIDRLMANREATAPLTPAPTRPPIDVRTAPEALDTALSAVPEIKPSIIPGKEVQYTPKITAPEPSTVAAAEVAPPQIAKASPDVKALEGADLERRVAMKFNTLPFPSQSPAASMAIAPKELAQLALKSKDFESFNQAVGARPLPEQVPNLQEFFDRAKGVKVTDITQETGRATFKDTTPIDGETYGKFVKQVINEDWATVETELKAASQRFSDTTISDQFNPLNLLTRVAAEIKTVTGFDDIEATRHAREVIQKYESAVWNKHQPQPTITEAAPSGPNPPPNKPFLIGEWTDPRNGIRFEHQLMEDQEVRNGFRVVRQEYQGENLLRQYALATGTKEQITRFLQTNADPRWSNSNKYGLGYEAGSGGFKQFLMDQSGTLNPEPFQRLYNDHVKDWLDSYKARLKGTAPPPNGFDAWIEGGDLNALTKPLRLPVWVAKRFPNFGGMVQASIDRIEQLSQLSGNWIREAKPFLVDLPEDHLKMVEQFLVKGDQIGATREQLTQEQLTERITAHRREVQSAGQDVYDAYMAVRKSLDMAWDETEAAFKRLGVPDTELAKLRQEMGFQPEYFPHSWPDGKFFVTAKDPATGETIFRATARSKGQGRRLYRELTDRYGASNLEVGKNVGLPEDLFFNLNPESAAEIARIAAGKMELPPEQMAELIQSIADTFKTRGAMQHFVNRQNVQGFQTEGLREVLTQYLSGMAGFISKMEAVPKYLAVFGKGEGKINYTKTPNLYGYARNYMRDVLENTSKFDQTLATWRGVMFHKFLGFIPKTAWVNLTQNWTAFAPWMAKEGQSMPELKVGIAMKDVLYDFPTFRALHRGEDTNFRGLNPAENAALSALFKTGALNDWQTQELIGPLYGRGWGILNKALDSSRWLFGTAESLNRTASALSAFRYYFEDLKKTLPEEGAFTEAVKKTRDAINHTHYLMGKYNLPEIARGGTAQKLFRSSGYQFKGFIHNYMEMVTELFREDPKAGARAVTNLTLLAGPLAIPLASEAYKVYKWFTGTDPLEDAFQNKDQDPGYTFIKYGLPGFLGVDVAQAIAPNVVMQDTPQDILMNLVLGPFGATMLQEVPQAYEMYKSGGGLRSIEAVAPTFAKNVLKAERERTEGVTTRRGQEIMNPETGEQAKLTGTEAFMQSMGFRPKSASLRSTEQENLTRRQENRQITQDRLASRYVRALRSEDEGEMESIWKEVDRYNEWAANRNEPPIDLLGIVKDRMKGKLPAKSWRPYLESIR